MRPALCLVVAFAVAAGIAFGALARTPEEGVRSLLEALRQPGPLQIPETEQSLFGSGLNRPRLDRDTLGRAIALLGPDAVPALLEYLADPSRPVRKEAVDALEWIRDPRSAIPLAKRLAVEPDSEIRKVVAVTLGKLGDKRAGEALLAALKDSNYMVRAHAARSLGSLGVREACRPLIRALQKERVKDARFAAAQGLGRLADARAFDALLAALKDPEASVREDAALALAAVGDPRALEPLTALLEDPLVRVRRRAVRSLGVLGDPRALPALILRLGDSDTWTARTAATALGQMGGPQAARALVGMLDAEKASVRTSAIEALAHMGARQAAPAVRQAMASPDAAVRRTAADALGWLGDRAAVGALISALKDPDDSVRERAVQALGNLAEPDTVDAVLAALKDEDTHVRYAAAMALRWFDAPRVNPALVEALADDRKEARMGAAFALALRGRPEGLGVLEEVVLGEEANRSVLDAHRAYLGAVCLAALDTPEAQAVLRRARDASRDIDVRRFAGRALEGTLLSALLAELAGGFWTFPSRAAEALGYLGDPAAVPALEKACRGSGGAPWYAWRAMQRIRLHAPAEGGGGR
ncbi:MAG: HEAT repeat domain-containing protein [Planctomycetota bacterium]|nr:HEAT repeat domain-containing protein [Planctomycetota bacterium]